MGFRKQEIKQIRGGRNPQGNSEVRFWDYSQSTVKEFKILGKDFQSGYKDRVANVSAFRYIKLYTPIERKIGVELDTKNIKWAKVNK